MEGRTIPKITHQIWLQGWKSLPPKFKGNVESLRVSNPGYTHMVWDEKTLREECRKLFPAVLAKFESYTHFMQKIEFGRLVVLYGYGGISVDTDMKSLKPIDTTPKIDTAELIVSLSAFPGNLIGQTNNAIVLAKPHHPLILELITRMTSVTAKENDFLTKELYLAGTTGPAIQNTFFHEHSGEIVFLDHTYYEPCFSTDPVCSPSKESIMDHKHEMSWMSPWMKVFLKSMIGFLYILLYSIPIGIVYWAYVRFAGKKRIFPSR
jgi:mannosyltransferase OCH1-like enzyme